MKQKCTVTGMTCTACSAHVEKAVGQVPGVRSVNVNLMAGSMLVDFDESRTSTDAIVHAVEDAGYSAQPAGATPAAAAVGTVLRLKPVLTIQGEKLDSYAKTRGMKAAFQTMMNALKDDINARFSYLREQGRLKIGIANTQMDEERFQTFKTQLEKTFPGLELIYFPLTMSIGAHVGPGALGIGAMRCH